MIPIGTSAAAGTPAGRNSSTGTVAMQQAVGGAPPEHPAAT